MTGDLVILPPPGREASYFNPRFPGQKFTVTVLAVQPDLERGASLCIVHEDGQLPFDRGFRAGEITWFLTAYLVWRP